MSPAAGMKGTSRMGFAPDWLALREPLDHKARDKALLAQARSHARPGAVIADLGCGTGSTARAFDEVGTSPWTWRFVDSDASLLEIAAERHPTAEPVIMDLGHIKDMPLQGVSLVTASALLDLMPINWLRELVARLKAAALPFYAALTYNGVMHWTPALDEDREVAAAFNAHQETDKGLGRAMGPGAARIASQIFSDHGFEVTLADSPWAVAHEHAELHGQLVDGIGVAAQEMGSDVAPSWVARRQAELCQTTAMIGHTDLLAVPRKTF